MLVWPGFEPATSCSADRRSPNWANQAAHGMRITTFCTGILTWEKQIGSNFQLKWLKYCVLLIEGGKTEDSRNQDSNFPLVLPSYFSEFASFNWKKYDFLGIGCILNFDFGRLKGFLPWSGQYRSCTDRLDLVAHYTCWKASHFSALSLQN